jgi:signal peptidase II
MIFYITIIIWITIDFLSKNLAYNYLQNKVNILGDFLFLKYTQNPWIAFSINIPFIKIITIILIIWIFYYYFNQEKSKNNKLVDLSFWLILAWAIWNWIERVINANVIDFIWVKYFSIFNLADSFITIGILIYLYILYKNN